MTQNNAANWQEQMDNESGRDAFKTQEEKNKNMTTFIHIRNGRTKGVWEVKDDDGKRLSVVYGETVIATVWGWKEFRHCETSKDKEADAAAIVSAVNNTYGKGINPESVEKMKETLELIDAWDGDTAKFPYRELKEALAAAKL